MEVCPPPPEEPAMPIEPNKIPVNNVLASQADADTENSPFSANHATPGIVHDHHEGTLVQSPTDVASAAAASDETGPTLAGCEIISEISGGAMGVVYKARQRKLNRVVALKMIRSEGRPDPRAIIRFLAEAEAVAAVRHPNVVQMFEYGEDAGRPFMLIEFCSGGTLTSRLHPNDGEAKRLDPREAVELLSRMARGVAAAHERGIVHRDLKPGNVLFDEAGNPKVADFGIAKRAASELTATMAVMGTPAYMSPEQAGGMTKFVGPQADVWSLGVIFHECLTGSRPFEGGTTDELLARVMRADPARLRTLVPGLPRDLELIGRKCLEKNPADRYATAKELADDLDRFLAGKPISVRPMGFVERTWRWTKRNPVVAGLLVVIAATTAGLIVSLAAQNRDAVAREASEREGRQKAEELVTEKDALVVAELARRKEAERLQKEAEDLQKEAERLRKAAFAELARADQVSEFMSGMFRLSDPFDLFGDSILPTNWEKDRNKTADQFLKDAAQRFRTELKDPSVKLVRAKLLAGVGNSMKNLGLFAESELALKEALEIRKASWKEDHPDVLRSELDLGRLELDLGYLQAAVDRFRRVHELQRRSGASQAALLTTKLYEGTALGVMGVPAAADVLREVADGREKLYGPNDLSTLLARVVLAAVCVDTMQMAEALKVAEVIQKGVDALPPTRFRDIVEAAQKFQIGLALAHSAKKIPNAALAEITLKPALDMVRTSLTRVEGTPTVEGLIPKDHILASLIRFELAKLLLKSGGEAEADRLLARVVDDIRNTTGLAQPKTINVLLVVADRLVETGKIDDARKLYEEFESASSKRFGPENPWRTLILLHRVIFEVEQNEPDKAVVVAMDAVRMADKGKLVPTRDTVAVLHNAAFALAKGKPSKPATAAARQLFGLNYTLVASVFGDPSPEMVIALSNHGDLLYRTGDRLGGIALYEKAEAMLAVLPKPPENFHLYDLAERRATAEADRGRFADAERYFRQAHKHSRSLEWTHASAATNLARVLVAQGKYAEAVPFLEQAKKALSRDKASQQELVYTDLHLAEVLVTAGEFEKHAELVTAMATKYAKSTDTTVLVRLGWAAALSPKPVGVDLPDVAKRISGKMGTFYWGERCLALLRLRSGELSLVEVALTRAGKDNAMSEAIRGLTAVARKDLSAARRALAKAEQLIEAAKPSEKTPFAYAGNLWHFRLETEILLNELRAAFPVLELAPPPREK